MKDLDNQLENDAGILLVKDNLQPLEGIQAMEEDGRSIEVTPRGIFPKHPPPVEKHLITEALVEIGANYYFSVVFLGMIATLYWKFVRWCWGILR